MMISTAESTHLAEEGSHSPVHMHALILAVLAGDSFV